LWDRQYFTSLAIFVAAAIATLAGMVSLLYWLGWAGLVGLVTIAGGFLAWFYWGPRPDLTRRGRGGKFDETGNE
jgi:hypothetical protein